MHFISKFNQPAARAFEKISSDVECFIEGTDFKATSEQGCICHDNFKGKDCGIPRRMWIGAHVDSSVESISTNFSSYGWSNSTLTRRPKNQRRLIHALPVNLEQDLFEARVASLYEVVDVFLIGESNLTNSGGTRDPTFLNLLKAGWLKPYHDKIVHVFRSQQPPTGYEDGALADAFMRSELTQRGLEQLRDIGDDDIFLYTDGDELPRPELLRFLKLYDNWPQPVAFKYKWAIFGFFWTVDEDVLATYSNPIPSAVTIDVLRDVYGNDSSLLRKALYYKGKDDNAHVLPIVENYRKKGTVIDQMSVMDAGWHCSWCFKPEGIRSKLLDAPKSDYPRYGDDRARTTVSYIKRLIKNGIYFNLSRLRKKGDEMTADKDPEFAPPYVQRHPDQYKHLLENPYKNVYLPRSH